jgi:hypothetical protein
LGLDCIAIRLCWIGLRLLGLGEIGFGLFELCWIWLGWLGLLWVGFDINWLGVIVKTRDQKDSSVNQLSEYLEKEQVKIVSLMREMAVCPNSDIKFMKKTWENHAREIQRRALHVPTFQCIFKEIRVQFWSFLEQNGAQREQRWSQIFIKFAPTSIVAHFLVQRGSWYDFS